MVAKHFAEQYVHQQLLNRATAAPGTAHTFLVSVDIAMDVVKPLLEELGALQENIAQLESDVDGLRRLDDESASG